MNFHPDLQNQNLCQLKVEKLLSLEEEKKTSKRLKLFLFVCFKSGQEKVKDNMPCSVVQTLYLDELINAVKRDSWLL